MRIQCEWKKEKNENREFYYLYYQNKNEWMLTIKCYEQNKEEEKKNNIIMD